MKKKLIIAGSIIIVVIILFLLVFSNSKIGEKISPIQIIKYSDENSTITITKNNLDKSASIEMDLFMKSEELKNEFMDLTEFTTNIMCGLMSLAFFDPEGLEEFNNQIKEWNKMNGVVEDEDGKEIGKPEENILEGYKIKKVKFTLKDDSTKNKISECIVTGASESDVIVNYY